MQENYGWDVCPNCSSVDKAVVEHGRHSLEAKYGSIPLEDWLVLQEKVKALEEDLEDPDTSALKEDLTIGFRNGESVFEVSFKCSCATCGFEYSFAHEEEIDIREEK